MIWRFLILGGTFCVPLWAAQIPGTISGTVRDAAGVAQMGAKIEVFLATPAVNTVRNVSSRNLAALSATPVVTAISDAEGFFEAVNLAAGAYSIRISAPSFLPILRQDLDLTAGATLVIDVTLKTLSEVIEMLPARRRTAADEDDWKWTLRSAANRPILRIVGAGGTHADCALLAALNDGSLNQGSELRDCVAESNSSGSPVRGEVAMVAGGQADGFGSSPDMTTVFNLERSLFSSSRISLGGNVDYGGEGVTPGTLLRASYSHQMPDGSDPEVAVTVNRFATPDMIAHDTALQALSASVSDHITVADRLDLAAGSNYQMVQFMGRVSGVRPYGSAGWHLTPNTKLEYRYATSVPDTRAMKGLDTSPVDFSESGPMVSLANFTPVLEKARHNEISLTRREGKETFQVAVYHDRIFNPALTGVGLVTSDSGLYLPDFYSGTFTWGGPNLATSGIRMVAQRELMPGLTATADYSYGGALTLAEANSVGFSSAGWPIETQRRQSVACKLSGTMPRSHTRWIASYRASLGGYTLTPVDAFNVSPGQTDAYVSLFIRQPLPTGIGFLQGRMEALLDVRNLLAQGYVPVVGGDGQTLYLVQSARAIRGGVAFTF
jgi:Carboxypeptidase regulatory-like domain/TonB dependent receptor